MPLDGRGDLFNGLRKQLDRWRKPLNGLRKQLDRWRKPLNGLRKQLNRWRERRLKAWLARRVGARRRSYSLHGFRGYWLHGFRGHWLHGRRGHIGWDLGGGVFFLITCPRSRGAQLRPLGQRALHVAHAIPLSFSDRSTVAMPARAAPGASPLGSLEGVADFADQKFQDIL